MSEVVEPGEARVRHAAVTIRRADLSDLPTLIELRFALFRDLGGLSSESDVGEVRQAIAAYLVDKLPTDSYMAWVAELDGAVVAAASLVIMEKMPSLHNPTGLEGYLMSVYTLPGYRRLGAAEALVRTAMAYARERGISRISLHASDQGRRLYARLGFAAMDNEMRWPAGR